MFTGKQNSREVSIRKETGQRRQSAGICILTSVQLVGVDIQVLKARRSRENVARIFEE